MGIFYEDKMGIRPEQDSQTRDKRGALDSAIPLRSASKIYPWQQWYRLPSRAIPCYPGLCCGSRPGLVRR